MTAPASPATDGAALGGLLDHAPCGFVSVADDGALLAVNATLHEMLGYAPGELEGARVDALLTMGSRLFYQTHLFPMVRLHGRAEEIFLLLRHKDGGEVGVLVNVARRERGGAFANDCVMMRVVERRKFEDELLRARRDADEARALAEARARELGEANELLEQQALELELQHQQMQEQAAELEAQAEALQEANAALQARGEELERLRGVAEEANRAKSTFLAVMSHELRTPLNAIGGYVQLIDMEIHGPVTPPQREALARIERSQKHLLRLINDVLNLARIEAGRVEFLVEEVGLAALLADVAPMVEPQMAARGIAFDLSVEPGVAVRADREKVQQVVLNLLSNACKFTPPGGRVSVDAATRAQRPGEVFLRVRDTGIGIPPEKLEAVFQPFVQVDMSRTRASEGSGLGLAISRDLARGMGGDLRARSVEGEGSTFTLTLPRA